MTSLKAVAAVNSPARCGKTSPSLASSLAVRPAAGLKHAGLTPTHDHGFVTGGSAATSTLGGIAFNRGAMLGCGQLAASNNW